MIDLVLVCIPPAQDSEQVFQFLQSPTTQYQLHKKTVMHLVLQLNTNHKLTSKNLH